MVKSGTEGISLEMLVHTTLVTLMIFVSDYYSEYNQTGILHVKWSVSLKIVRRLEQWTCILNQKYLRLLKITFIGVCVCVSKCMSPYSPSTSCAPGTELIKLSHQACWQVPLFNESLNLNSSSTCS